MTKEDQRSMQEALRVAAVSLMDATEAYRQYASTDPNYKAKLRDFERVSIRTASATRRFAKMVESDG